MRVPAALTVSDTVRVCITPPLVPAIVNGNVPVPVPVVVVIVSVDAADGLGLTGVAIEQVAPGGQPVTVSATLPLKPFNAVTVAVEVPATPCASVSEDGLTEIEKSGAKDTAVHASTSAQIIKLPSGSFFNPSTTDVSPSAN